MKSNEIYRLFDLVESDSDDEKLVMEVLATLQNYEYLKTKLPKCICYNGTMYIEEICIKCGGINRDDESIYVWNW